MPVRFVARFVSLLALISGSLLYQPSLAQAQRAPYQPVTVTDDSGVQTMFVASPRRIISLNTGPEVASGDTYQQTTKGLAIYSGADNTPAFVSGMRRWALAADGVVERSTAPDQ